jgi:hypothetical protein
MNVLVLGIGIRPNHVGEYLLRRGPERVLILRIKDEVSAYIEGPSSNADKDFQSRIALFESCGAFPEVEISLGHLNDIEGTEKHKRQLAFPPFQLKTLTWI